MFLHEGLGSVALWRDFPARLLRATGYNGLVYSRAGYGNSQPLKRSRSPHYMHEEALEVLPRVLEQHGIVRPILFGHSDGGSIALIFAGDGRWEVDALILEAPHVFVEEVSVQGNAGARAAYETGALRERLSRYHADVDGAFYGWNDIWLHPDFRDWNIEASLRAIAVPMLLIQGAADEYGSFAQADAIRAGVRAAHVTELRIADCGHAPHGEDPGAVIAASTEFLAAL